MKKKQIFSILISILLVSGCSMFQPSTYENRSNNSVNSVTATGKAAENAALANTTDRRTISNNYSGSSGYSSPYNNRSIGDDLMSTTQRTITSEASNLIRRSIREATDNLFY
jgi:PBP1b-binding outer membrane lipoprotein LpoB